MGRRHSINQAKEMEQGKFKNEDIFYPIIKIFYPIKNSFNKITFRRDLGNAILKI